MEKALVNGLAKNTKFKLEFMLLMMSVGRDSMAEEACNSAFAFLDELIKASSDENEDVDPSSA